MCQESEYGGPTLPTPCALARFKGRVRLHLEVSIFLSFPCALARFKCRMHLHLEASILQHSPYSEFIKVNVLGH